MSLTTGPEISLYNTVLKVNFRYWLPITILKRLPWATELEKMVMPSQIYDLDGLCVGLWDWQIFISDPFMMNQTPRWE